MTEKRVILFIVLAEKEGNGRSKKKRREGLKDEVMKEMVIH